MRLSYGLSNGISNFSGIREGRKQVYKVALKTRSFTNSRKQK